MAIHHAPRSPIAARITAVAGVRVTASPSGPSTFKHTTLTARYSTTTPVTPATHPPPPPAPPPPTPRERPPPGGRLPPATNVEVCHPPYANPTGIMAAPIAPSNPSDTGRSNSGNA